MTHTVENDAGVPVPRGALIHLEVADDVAACEQAGKDWTGTGDFYLTKADSPLAKYINCPDCAESRVIPPVEGRSVTSAGRSVTGGGQSP